MNYLEVQQKTIAAYHDGYNSCQKIAPIIFEGKGIIWSIEFRNPISSKIMSKINELMIRYESGTGEY